MADGNCRFTIGKVNFIKVSELLLDDGRTIIRELFDLKVPPANLAAQLQTVTRSSWNQDQKKVLFPSTGIAVSSTSFDISLLCKLLREIGNLPPHRWDQPLDPTDHSLAAEIRRAKNYRNKLAHQGTRELDVNDFNTFWNEIKAILLGIVRLTPPQQTADERVRKWETAIDKLYSKHVIETDRKWARQLLEYTEVVIEFTTRLASAGAWLLGNAQILQRYIADPNSLIALVQEAVLPLGMEVFGFLRGSVKIVIWTREPKALEEFWRRYQTGQLREDLEKVLITEELKQLANGDAVELKLTVSEEEYRRAHEYLTGEDKEATEGDETAKEEEELAHGLQETKLTSDFDFDTFDGDIFEDGQNKFQAHLAVITSKDQVEQVLAELKKKDPDVAEATHNIWAYRIFDAEKDAYFENCDDDGDDTSGARVLRFLQRTEAVDVMIVVSCWYETTADDLGPVRFKYIQKSVLDLILACGIVELQTSKIKKYFEEIKYTPFEKVKQQKTPKFEILHGEPIEDRKSTFQGHLADITSRQQVDQVLAELKKDRKIAKAKYNMWACRIYDEKKKSYLEEGNDDGENQGGDRILHLLRRSDAKNVVVIVTRWHGGIHLGNDRFKHINKCASDLLQQRSRLAAEASTTSDPKETRKKSKKHK